jgi:proteic killer suppression protein
VQKIARRKLVYLDDAEDLRDLAAPPGNRLEALQGTRAGQYSIRINEQWRICFVWETGQAHSVEIVDYHQG